MVPRSTKTEEKCEAPEGFVGYRKRTGRSPEGLRHPQDEGGPLAVDEVEYLIAYNFKKSQAVQNNLGFSFYLYGLG